MIGAAALLLMATVGKIAGISGIVSRLLPPMNAEANTLKESLSFVVGLLVAAPLYKLSTGSLPDQTITASVSILAVAGFLVGFGTVLSNGCTSGHGVCGLSRLSVRSIAATATFMIAAALTVYAMRHVIGG